jgi:transcriptional regulator with XRE-family HTH domain
LDTIDKILQLMNSTGATAAQLTQEAGITNGLITQWKSRKQEPSTKNLRKIATYFDVSLDWLSGNEQKNKPAAQGDELNKEDQEFVDKIKMLSPENRRQIEKNVEFLLAGQSDKE